MGLYDKRRVRGKRDSGTLAWCLCVVGGTISLHLCLSFSLIALHVTSKWDRTNVCDSKESVILNAHRLEAREQPCRPPGEIQTPISSDFVTLPWKLCHFIQQYYLTSVSVVPKSINVSSQLCIWGAHAVFLRPLSLNLSHFLLLLHSNTDKTNPEFFLTVYIQ